MSSSHSSADVKDMLFAVHSLSVYRALMQDRAVAGLIRLLSDDAQTALDAAVCYGTLLETLQKSGLSLCDYIYRAALCDVNGFTRACACGRPADEWLPAVRHDLRALAALAYVKPVALKARMCEKFPAFAAQIDALPDYAAEHVRFFADERDWAAEIGAMQEYWSC